VERLRLESHQASASLATWKRATNTALQESSGLRADPEVTADTQPMAATGHGREDTWRKNQLSQSETRDEWRDITVGGDKDRLIWI
jgi:hypothetical protein